MKHKGERNIPDFSKKPKAPAARRRADRNAAPPPPVRVHSRSRSTSSRNRVVVARSTPRSEIGAQRSLSP